MSTPSALDQWEAEAKPVLAGCLDILGMHPDGIREDQIRIIALIELVRKQHEKLKIISEFQCSTDKTELLGKWGAMIMTAEECRVKDAYDDEDIDGCECTIKACVDAIAFTDQLGKEDKK